MLDQQADLDRAFHALSDATRRAILVRLGEGPATVKELAQPFSATLAAIVQHVQVLEGAGLISTEKIGRARTCTLSEDAILRAERWLNERRKHWTDRLDRLGALVEAMPDLSDDKADKE